MTASAVTGWLALVAAVAWLLYDKTGRIPRAILAGYVTIALAVLHIFLSMRGGA